MNDVRNISYLMHIRYLFVYVPVPSLTDFNTNGVYDTRANKKKVELLCVRFTAQKMKFSIKDFFSKCDQIRRKLQIWSHLLKKCLIESFIYCTVNFMQK